MKEIGKSETGIICELSVEECSLVERAQKVIVIVKGMCDQMGDLIRCPVEDPAKNKRKYKRRICTPKTPKHPAAVKIPAPAVTEKKQTMVELAVETMKRIGTPCSLEQLVNSMKTQGCKFKSMDPAGSLGIQLTQAKAAMVVGRDGMKGLWMLPGPEAKEKRKEYLMSVGEKD